jgi:hypothetical protein
LEFDEIINGSQRLIGPFVERTAAEHSWRDVSEQHRAHCRPFHDRRRTLTETGKKLASQ